MKKKNRVCGRVLSVGREKDEGWTKEGVRVTGSDVSKEGCTTRNKSELIGRPEVLTERGMNVMGSDCQ
jgi:hypothetical protein